MDEHLYQAILTRRSVRRYDRARLDGGTLAQVREIISGVEPLVSDNRFEVLVRDVAEEEDLVETLGGYGRIVSPPHYLVPYGIGETHLLTDLGYRVEQIAVRLVGRGIGSCFIASLGREKMVRRRFELPEAARIAAFLVFGHPASSLGGRVFNAGARWVVGATNKLPVERIFFQESFNHPTVPPTELAPLIEAARHAPSAANAQPWRLLWRAGVLYMLVQRENRRYGGGAGNRYRWHDGGICMANVALALEGLGIEGRWQLLEETDLDLPDHPTELQALAKLELGRAAQEGAQW
jgi:nitroreductase